MASIPIIDWPAAVPSCVLPLATSGGPRDNRLSFDTEDKMPPIERPLSSWTPDVYSVELVPISEAQFAVFEAWFKNDLRFGVYPFKWAHPVTRVLSPWKFVKADPAYTVRKSRRTPRGSGIRGISISFTVMSWAGSFGPTYVLQEGVDDVLQEQADRILESEGFTFNG